MIIIADADRLQERLNFPVTWKTFREPTYEKGDVKTSPDVASSLYLDYKATVGEKISDHHLIEIKARYYEEKTLYSIFPYRKDMKEILKAIRENKNRPIEPIKRFLGKALLLTMQGMAILSYKEVVKKIENAKRLSTRNRKRTNLMKKG